MITITVGDVNRPPTIDPIENQTISEGEFVELVVSAYDPDGDTLQYSASNLPIGASFDPVDQKFSWIPGFDQAGHYPDIFFTVTDNGEQPFSTTLAIQITVGNVNRPPIISPVGDRSAMEGEAIQFTVTATDPDGESVTTIAGNLPDGAVFDEQTQEFSWIPGYDQAGQYDNIYFTAADNGSPVMETTETISITIGNINRPPILDPMGDLEINLGETYEGIVSASDPDGDVLTYQLILNPDGMTIDPVTGRIVWIPVDSQTGNHIIQVQADDGYGGTHITEFSINVAGQTYPIRARVRVWPKWLWPPNYKMKTVRTRVKVFNTPDPNPEIILTSITSNETDNGPGTGNTSPDIIGADFGTPDFKFKLRAARNGHFKGRIYTITYTITDAWGNKTTAKAYVRVPKKPIRRR